MKQYLKYWCSPGYSGDPSNDPPVLPEKGMATVRYNAALKNYLSYSKMFGHHVGKSLNLQLISELVIQNQWNKRRIQMVLDQILMMPNLKVIS